MNSEPDPNLGPSPWRNLFKILLRVAIGVVIALLLLFGVCLALIKFH